VKAISKREKGGDIILSEFVRKMEEANPISKLRRVCVYIAAGVSLPVQVHYASICW